MEIARGWTVPFPSVTDPTRVADGSLGAGAMWFAYGEEAAYSIMNKTQIVMCLFSASYHHIPHPFHYNARF